jgi:hypothetical protein
MMTAATTKRTLCMVHVILFVVGMAVVHSSSSGFPTANWKSSRSWESSGTSGNDDIDDSCLSPAKDPHGQWSYPADGSQAFQPGDQSILTCDSGYSPTAEDGEDMDTASQMSCGSGGLWEFYGSFAICVPKGSSNGAKDDGNGGNGDSNSNGDANYYYEPEVDTSGHKTRTKVQKYTDESFGTCDLSSTLALCQTAPPGDDIPATDMCKNACMAGMLACVDDPNLTAAMSAKQIEGLKELSAGCKDTSGALA